MISDETRQKLRDAAIKNNFGGNTTVQRDYSSVELRDLLEKYKELDCKNTFRSLFSDKKYSTLIKWKNDVGRHLSKQSRRNFFFLIEQSDNGPTFCPCCKTELGIDSFMTNPSYNNYLKYCIACTKTRSWVQYIDQEKRGQSISAAKLLFYATDKGKEIAKQIGKKNSDALKEFHKTEKGQANRKKSAIHNSKIMTEKILSGEFTPQIRNSRTHWTAEFNGQKFRSAWEAMWYAIMPNLVYETIRIPYTINNKDKIYIVDFEDRINKILYEVKPIEHTTSSLSEAKILAATKWANANGYSFKVITQNELIDNLDIILKSSLPEYIKVKAQKLCRK